MGGTQGLLGESQGISGECRIYCGNTEPSKGAQTLLKRGGERSQGQLWHGETEGLLGVHRAYWGNIGPTCGSQGTIGGYKANW
jgi:hypothetical protein